MNQNEIEKYRWFTESKDGATVAKPLLTYATNIITIFPAPTLTVGREYDGKELKVELQRWHEFDNEWRKAIKNRAGYKYRQVLRLKQSQEEKLSSVQPIPGQQQKVETAKDLQIAKFEALLRKYGIFEYDVRIFSVLEEMQSNWQQSQSIEPMVDKVLEYICHYGEAKAMRDDSHSIYEVVIDSEQIKTLKPQLLKLLKD